MKTGRTVTVKSPAGVERKCDDMNELTEAISALSKDIGIFRDNDLFMTDLLLNNELSCAKYIERQNNLWGHSAYPIDLYLCMLCAGVSRERIFSEHSAPCCTVRELAENAGDLWFDPCIAVYAGEYELAKCLIGNLSGNIYNRLIDEECWDFLDYITDCGKNSEHIRIVAHLLAADYLRNGQRFYRYMSRYSAERSMTCKELTDKALLEINSADRLMNAIASEAAGMILQPCSDADRRKFNKRATGIMSRCAYLGMTLGSFAGFGKMLLPVYSEKTSLPFGESVGIEPVMLPETIAELISENTVIYSRSVREGISEANALTIPYSDVVCFFDDKENEDGTGQTDELRYICTYFLKKYGRKPVIRIETYKELIFSGLTERCRGLFEPELGDDIFEELYRSINSLKNVLDSGVLTQKSIDDITKYFVSKIGTSGGKDHAFAVKRLSQLSTKLVKMKGRKK